MRGVRAQSVGVPVPWLLHPHLHPPMREVVSRRMAWRLMIVWSSMFALALGNAIHHPIFNLGDSNSDTGNMIAINWDASPDLPYGRTFFHKHTGRASDGRLIIDFLCESLNVPFLSPYLMPFGGNFRNGANFAYGGASIKLGEYGYKLASQIQMLEGYQFIVMHDPWYKDYHMAEEDGAELRRGLYIIDIGQNDLQYSFDNANFSYEDARKQIPEIIGTLFVAINDTLTFDGARKIWLHGTGPLGCLPHYAVTVTDGNKKDTYGCLVAANDLAKDFNNQLRAMCQRLNVLFSDPSRNLTTTVVYTDIYSIKYDLIANYIIYGFEDPMRWCLQTEPPCPLGSRYISWDSIHYTDAANAIVAAKILSGAYSKPPIKFAAFYYRWES